MAGRQGQTEEPYLNCSTARFTFLASGSFQAGCLCSKVLQPPGTLLLGLLLLLSQLLPQ